jgi:hypothetical protein
MVLFLIMLSFILGAGTSAYFIVKDDDEDYNEEWTEEDYEFMKNYRIEEQKESDEKK